MTHPLQRDLTIRPLLIEEARQVSALLRAQPPEYARFFHAFNSDEKEIAAILAARQLDIYSGIFWEGRLIGFFMLRGWDDGYDVPAFGVFIDEKFRGFKLMRLALDSSILISRLCGAKRIMGKIHPDNAPLRGVRQLGFVQTGVEDETGRVIFHLDL
jgi:RimJ/RimL family protein N-acetyltransferase